MSSSKSKNLVRVPVTKGPKGTKVAASLISSPYFVIIEAAGVRLPACLFRGLWAAFFAGRPLTFYLLIHDALDAFPEFFKRFALFNEFEDCFQQCLCYIHFFHSPHHPFWKALRLCLTCSVYYIEFDISISKEHKYCIRYIFILYIAFDILPMA